MPRPRRLFLACTANICRSPMAAGWAREATARAGTPAEVRSGGTMGLVGRPAAPNSVRAMREKGVDISDHRSAAITAEDLRWADHVLVMEMRHRVALLQQHPWADEKVLLLGQFGGMHEIDDPVGGWIWRFRRSRDKIIRCVDGYLAMAPPPVGD
jgi:protein-tyrosine phosphatase